MNISIQSVKTRGKSYIIIPKKTGAMISQSEVSSRLYSQHPTVVLFYTPPDGMMFAGPDLQLSWIPADIHTFPGSYPNLRICFWILTKWRSQFATKRQKKLLTIPILKTPTMIVGFFRDPVTFGSLQNGGGLTPVIHGLMAAAVQSLPAKNTPNDAQKNSRS